MLNNFTLLYWLDDGWYVGKLKEVPRVFSQGETLEELKENIKDAFALLMESDSLPVEKYHSTSIQMETA